MAEQLDLFDKPKKRPQILRKPPLHVQLWTALELIDRIEKRLEVGFYLLNANKK